MPFGTKHERARANVSIPYLIYIYYRSEFNFHRVAESKIHLAYRQMRVAIKTVLPMQNGDLDSGAPLDSSEMRSRGRANVGKGGRYNASAGVPRAFVSPA